MNNCRLLFKKIQIIFWTTVRIYSHTLKWNSEYYINKNIVLYRYIYIHIYVWFCISTCISIRIEHNTLYFVIFVPVIWYFLVWFSIYFFTPLYWFWIEFFLISRNCVYANQNHCFPWRHIKYLNMLQLLINKTVLFFLAFIIKLDPCEGP